MSAEGIELDGGPQVWSSTYVRTCLAAGDVAGAAEALGRPYAVRGEVVRGDQRGRDLGYPTANVPIDARTAAPADGVYAGWLRRLDTGETLPGAISVGTNPTFAGERERRVETYVLDRTDLELYGVEVEVGFVERLRGMTAFDSVDELLEQMADDVAGARELLRRDPGGLSACRRAPRCRCADGTVVATTRSSAPTPGSWPTGCPTSCPRSAPRPGRRSRPGAPCRGCCWWPWSPRRAAARSPG